MAPSTLQRRPTLGIERVREHLLTSLHLGRLTPGDRVVSASVSGAYAEWTLAPAERVVPVPDRVTSKQAAAVLLQGLTAHYLAFSTYPLDKGDTCLVHAAAGGVGLLLCQVARRAGARVIGTASSEEKAALANVDDVVAGLHALTGRQAA